MGVLRSGLLVLHFVGLASLLGGYLTQLRSSVWRVLPAMRDGALTQLVTGLALVAVLEAGPDPVNVAKMAVKLVILLVILGVLWVNRSRESMSLVAFQGVGLLTGADIVVAVFWS
mgnify:CR=1 FL=1